MMKRFNQFHLKCGQTELESQQEESERKALEQSAKSSLSKCMDECILFYNQSLDENEGGSKKRNSQGPGA